MKSTISLFITTLALCSCGRSAGPSDAGVQKPNAPTTAAAAFPVKGYSIGMSLSSYAHNSICSPHGDAVTCLDKSPGDTIGEHEVVSAYLKFGKDKKAESVVLTFKQAAFEDVKSAVTAKFGALKCATGMSKDENGKAMLNEICTKESPVDTIMVGKYGDNTSECALMLVSNEADQQEQTRRRKDI